MKSVDSNGMEFAVICGAKKTLADLSLGRGDLPLKIGAHWASTALGLFEAFRYPDRPDWQAEILQAPSGQAARVAARLENRLASTRSDWETIKIKVMQWVLKVRLVQHPEPTTRSLRAVRDRILIDLSTQDPYWGLRKITFGFEPKNEFGFEGFWGKNALGKLWKELKPVAFGWGERPVTEVVPPDVPEMVLLGEPVPLVNPIPVPVAPPFYRSVLDASGCLLMGA